MPSSKVGKTVSFSRSETEMRSRGVVCRAGRRERAESERGEGGRRERDCNRPTQLQ